MIAVVIFTVLSVLLILGKALRISIPFLQRLYLPSSVIGGLLGLAILTACPAALPAGTVSAMRELPGFFINIIFATLFLGVAAPRPGTLATSVFPQFVLAQVVVWGQYAIGIGLCGFLLLPLFGVHPAFGNLLELGFEGGHGTVSGMSQAFLAKDWKDGLDLGYALATIGMVCGIIVGMGLVNWAYRNGHVKTVRPFDERSALERKGIHAPEARPVAGRQTVIADSVDSLAWHVAIVGIAILIGWTIQRLIPLEGFPLFPLCMLGGILLQAVARLLRINLLIDREQMLRISGAALDFLSLSAVSTIKISTVAQNWIPLVILAVAGVLWTAGSVLFLAPRIFKDAWFERGIAEFGQATGVTATGLLLLRTVDPENKTPASAAFAGKQLLHEPAMGFWVALAFALICSFGWFPVFLICLGVLAFWGIVTFLLILRRKKAISL